MTTSDVTFDGQAEFETPKSDIIDEKAKRIYQEIYGSSLTLRAFGWLTGKDLDIEHVEKKVTGLGITGENALSCIKSYHLGKFSGQVLVTGAALGSFWLLKKKLGL